MIKSINNCFYKQMRFKYTDYHIHTKWSSDIINNGPSFEDYLPIAKKNRMNICFLEHYELYKVENDKFHPFFNGKIEKYLDEIDEIKETHDFVLSGLEVDYYKERENDLLEFLDEYRKCIDFIAGSVHECDIGYPITEKSYILRLLKTKSLKQLIDDYFISVENMIRSKIFKNICHIDTVLRYINPNEIKPSEDCDISDKRIFNLGLLCIENGINIEYNLSGPKYSLGRTFPSKKVITNMRELGANIFIGSDSHDLKYFKDTISNVKKAYKIIEQIEAK
ncbi:MAG: histidinol-phosphatase HisJ family protein [Candidatus Lokiarchaeota archaeon]|nr:histidinol-phosphatase HisJ family protein [Candidatus Lokiarchaeota archaeon]